MSELFFVVGVSSTGKDDHLHRPNMYFYNTGLWGNTKISSQGFRMKDFATILKELKHQNVCITNTTLKVSFIGSNSIHDQNLVQLDPKSPYQR